jgi:hypothetical protein
MRLLSRFVLAALVGTGALAGGCALVLGDFKLPADGAGGSGGSGGSGSTSSTGATTTSGGCGADEVACGPSCVKTASDPANCGKCGHACVGAEVCTNSACGLTCPAGQDPCNGTCAAVQTDPKHCGSCAVACEAVPNAAPHCAAGKCTLMCDPGFDPCKGACVQLDGGPCP